MFFKLQQFEKFGNMEENKSSKALKKDELENKYSKISYEMRKTLIEMATENGLSIYRAAKILNINHSTAKAIMRKYRKYGHIFRRKHEESDFHSNSPHNNITGPLLKTEENLSEVDKQEFEQPELAVEHHNTKLLCTGDDSGMGYYYNYFFIIPVNWAHQLSL